MAVSVFCEEHGQFVEPISPRWLACIIEQCVSHVYLAAQMNGALQAHDETQEFEGVDLTRTLVIASKPKLPCLPMVCLERSTMRLLFKGVSRSRAETDV